MDEPEYVMNGDDLSSLKEIIGMETYGRLLEACKITAREPASTLRKAIEKYATLVGHENDGWAVELVHKEHGTRAFHVAD